MRDNLETLTTQYPIGNEIVTTHIEKLMILGTVGVVAFVAAIVGGAVIARSIQSMGENWQDTE